MSASHPACASTHKLYGEGRVFPMATLIASNLPYGTKKTGGMRVVRERPTHPFSCHLPYIISGGATSLPWPGLAWRGLGYRLGWVRLGWLRLAVSGAVNELLSAIARLPLWDCLCTCLRHRGLSGSETLVFFLLLAIHPRLPRTLQ